MKPEIIIRIPFPRSELEFLRQDFTVRHAPTPEEFEKALTEGADSVVALVTNGVMGVSRDELSRLKKLQIVQTGGVGYENVDLAAIKERGLPLATGKGTNAFAVADHAMALLLGIARNVVASYLKARDEGQWLEMRMRCACAWQKRLGILGLGEIGMMVAKRAEGFDMSVAYHNRTRRDDAPYAYKASALELAEGSDFVIIALPGGPQTSKLVGTEFLDALGPNGYLINVGRGSIVDNDALMAALREKRIAGAALDVIDGEPNFPREMFDIPNLMITPHLGGRSLESMVEVTRRIHRNLKAQLAGEPLVSRIA